LRRSPVLNTSMVMNSSVVENVEMLYIFINLEVSVHPRISSAKAS
jgi:hypothetical protein